MGRLYLPREELRDAGIISDRSGDGAGAIRCSAKPAAAIVGAGEGRVRKSARAIMAQCPRRAVRAPRIMGEAYRLILDQLIARGFAPPRAPVHLPRAKILLDRVAQSVLMPFSR